MDQCGIDTSLKIVLCFVDNKFEPLMFTSTIDYMRAWANGSLFWTKMVPSLQDRFATLGVESAESWRAVKPFL